MTVLIYHYSKKHHFLNSTSFRYLKRGRGSVIMTKDNNKSDAELFKEKKYFQENG